jgi:hypothetical protein
MELNVEEDDGTLKWLNIDINEGLTGKDKYFNGKEVHLKDIFDKKVYVLDYADNITTKYGDNRMIISLKYDLDSEESFKLFISNQRVKRVMIEIGKRKKFPRKLTFKNNGKTYYVE